jgi:hypothetical protein
MRLFPAGHLPSLCAAYSHALTNSELKMGLQMITSIRPPQSDKERLIGSWTLISLTAGEAQRRPCPMAQSERKR